jgi:hypothetical protein
VLTITISPAGKESYHARLGSRHLCTSKTPFFSAARVLIADGADPAAILAMTREGSAVVDLRGRLGSAAGLTILENGTIGPVLKPYRAFPGKDAAAFAGAAACA